MSFPISISKTAEQLPVDPLLVVTRAAIGLGLGILMADKIKPSIRQESGHWLVAIGALAAAPWLVKITLGRLLDRNQSGGAAPVCVPFAAIPVIPPIRISINWQPFRLRSLEIMQATRLPLQSGACRCNSVSRDRGFTNHSRPFATQSCAFASARSLFGSFRRALFW